MNKNKTPRKIQGKRSANASKRDFDRGRIETVTLKRPFTFNGSEISQAIIEIDHINFGLDRRTLKLNTKRRSGFTIADIEKFLSLLDEEYIAPSSHKGRTSRYEMRIDSPIAGKFEGRTFIMVFEINYDTSHLIHTITLFPNW